MCGSKVDTCARIPTARETPGGRARTVAYCIAALAFAGCAEPPDTAPGIRTEPLPLDAAPGSAQPHLAEGENGELVLSWLEPGEHGMALRFSTLVDGAWSPPGTVTTGNNWFVNWADFPSVVPVSGERWAAHWLVKRAGGTYAYDIAIALSDNAGTTWSDPFTPHRDGTETEHGFVSLFSLNGRPAALWLDGRHTQPDSGHEHDGASSGAMTLRSASFAGLDNAGDPLLADQTVADERVCDCCQTDVAMAGATPVAVYRNRSDTEIRDIYVTRWTGKHWTEGQAVADDGWNIAGCPVNGPAIAADSDTVAVAWFTAANDVPRVRYALSTDGGRRFEPPVDIAKTGTLGRVDVVLLDDTAAIVSYLDKAPDGAANIMLRAVTPDGEPLAATPVAVTSAGRMAGFPQLARVGDSLVLAWTDVESGSMQVRSTRVPIDQIR